MQRAGSPSLRLAEADRAQLEVGAAALGVELDPGTVTAFSSFADLLDLWSRQINLISCHGPRELIDRHFLDSLAIEPFIPSLGTLVDLGSGAGFPGIPLALVAPTRRVLLVESRRRRANFLREVRRTLHLKNVEVLEINAENPPSDEVGGTSVVVSRAVWAETSILEIAAKWLCPEGHLVWMRSDPVARENGSAALEWERTVRYRIGSDRSRVLEVFRAPT